MDNTRIPNRVFPKNYHNCFCTNEFDWEGFWPTGETVDIIVRQYRLFSLVSKRPSMSGWISSNRFLVIGKLPIGDFVYLRLLLADKYCSLLTLQFSLYWIRPQKTFRHYSWCASNTGVGSILYKMIYNKRRKKTYYKRRDSEIQSL